MPNVSEGRDHAVLDALSAACGPALLDRHVDADHHRCVLTLADPDPAVTIAAAHRLAVAVADRLDLRTHSGSHPRLGALDVVPFVALGDAPDAAVPVATAFGAWIADVLAAPVFFYDRAAADGRSLPEIRRTAFTDRSPDLGPARPHPRLGAVAVGARAVLVAVNCWLADDDLGLARRVASTVRERDGGLPGVRALGLALPGRRLAQVSMNLVDLDRTGLEAACTAVRDAVAARGGRVARVELVGLVPTAELERCGTDFLTWAGIGTEDTIEARLAARP